MGVFGWNLKKTIVIFKAVPSNFSICEFSRKIKKYLHLGQIVLYFGNFGLEFEKTIVIFEINALEFVKLQSLVQNKNL